MQGDQYWRTSEDAVTTYCETRDDVRHVVLINKDADLDAVRSYDKRTVIYCMEKLPGMKALKNAADEALLYGNGWNVYVVE